MVSLNAPSHDSGRWPNERDYNREFRRARRLFAEHLFDGLRESFRALVARGGKKPVVLWTHHGLNCARLVEYSNSFQRWSPPVLWRIDVNGLTHYPTFADAQRLGLSDRFGGFDRSLSTPDRERLELSIRPEELNAITPWVVAWVVSRQLGKPLPKCPVPLHPRWPVTGDYLWTREADHDCRAWELIRDERVKRLENRH